MRQPLGTVAQEWKEKILAAECSVSLHVRHGDFAYNPNIAGASIYKILPLNYYQECINYFKREFKNPTLFVFSDNLEWCKENLQAGIPTNFVEGEDLTDENELYLMSICKHNIIANSTFSWWGAWLNQNPDKKVFAPIPSSIVGTKNTYRGFSAETNKNSPLESERWIKVPFDLDNQPDITQRPIFSLLLVVNNDAATIAETLDSLLGQDYKYYEVIIIDNASTNGSETICRQAAKSKANVIYKRLRKKVSNSVAWNRAFKAAQGQYVSFLKIGDCFLSNSLSTLYLINERRQGDIIHMFAWLAKNENGTVTFGDKKYAEQRDARLKGLNKTIMSTNGVDAARILLNQQFNSFLGTKFYNCDFLKQKKIKFDERLSDNEAELFFQTESFFKSKCLIYAVNAFYIAP